MGKVAPIKKHGRAPADSGGDLDVFASSYRPHANSLIIVKKQRKRGNHPTTDLFLKIIRKKYFF